MFHSVQILDTLTTYDNIVTPNDYQNSSIQMKKTFTALTRDLLVALCKNVAYSQPSVSVSSKLVTLSAQKRPFDSVSTDEVEIPCGVNCTTESALLLGQEMENNYKSWSCSSETCTGKRISLHFLENPSYNQSLIRTSNLQVVKLTI